MKERELKFTPGPSFRMPDLNGVGVGMRAGPPETVRLQAAYFDTDDLRLARAGASLRHRNDEGWMVKLPVSRDTVLTRLELTVPGESGEPPEAAVDLVHALIRRAPLRLTARLNTLRHRFVLLDHRGEQLAEIVDDEVSVLDGARLAARFREIEVEFTDSATLELVEKLETRLQAAGAGAADPVPKIVRALGPRALDPSDLAPPRAELDFASTPADVLRAAVTSSTARLIAHDPGVRLGADSEDVHQARVATRRLRSDLRTFDAVVDPAWSEPLRAELRWMGERLGAVRDTDVLLERFDARLVALPPSEADAGKQLLEGLRDHRTRARDELLEAMRSDRYLALLDRLVAATRAIPPSPGEDLEIELGDLVAQPWRKLQRAVEELGDDPPDVALHAVRIRAKRCRYAAEAVALAIGNPARRFARAVAGLQEVLGEHQDAVIAGQWLRAHAVDGGGTVECAFVAGELAALEGVAAAASRAEWPAAWMRARAKGLRQWL